MLTPVHVGGSRPRGADGRLRVAWLQAASFVEQSWGERPAPERRLAHRKMLQAACLLDFVAMAVPGLVLYVGGMVVEVDGLRWLGAVLVSTGSCFVAFDLALIVRQHGTSLDFHEWDRAGRPGEWRYRQWSQPRTSDLAVAGLLAAASFIFFMLLCLG
ncbi:hypothetical protein [Cellulomonas endometrii]|uniref:hypothetical protein n=1 Tax=Cellulomonas endometrii TaxID=3036301 RepID=UPI0024ADD3EE|nr:hypothetical protein [Cellulomonas endometrii]